MIPEIYITAFITSMLSLALIGGPLFMQLPREQRPFLAGLVLMMLPMHPLVFYVVRIPMDRWLSSYLDAHNSLYQLVRTLYAPLTEEPAKLWPLLIPLIFRRVKEIPLHRVAFAIGLGFGIGEMWTVARILSQSPEFSTYPWYMFGGYLSERLMVCVVHSGFTASALVLAMKHKRCILGVFTAMFLHFVGNFPLFLAGKNAFGFGSESWRMMVSIWVMITFFAMGCFLAYLAYGRRWLKCLVRGQVICPECKRKYQHPIFGVNLCHKRFERCPHCRHWHMVSAFDEGNSNPTEVLE